MATKGRTTQDIVNVFPEWANIRSDEQSMGFQLTNIAGIRMDDLRKQLEHINTNHYISTSIVDDIDVFYSVQLPGDFTFTKEDDDDTEFLYTPPTVSGVSSDIWYDISMAAENNIETFWYTPAPDRISLEETVTGDWVLASGCITHSPLPIIPASGLAHAPNKLLIKLEGGTSYIGVGNKGTIRKGIVQVEGVTREGASVTEELIFVHDETQQTMHEFKSVTSSGLRIYGVNEPEDTTVTLLSAGFRQEDYPAQYDLDKTVTGDDMPLFWALGSGINDSVQTLDLHKYDIDDLALRIDGFVSKSVILQQELLDTAGSGINPLDLAVQPHSDNLWVVDSGTLYLYSANLPYPDLSVMDQKEYDAPSVVEPNVYYTTIGETVEIDYLWRKPTVGLASHRAWMIKPDGTKKSLESGSEVTYHTDASSWVFGEPFKRKIRDTEFYTLDQRGDYVFCLEVRYSDESTSLDQRVVSVLYQQARAQYNLTSLGIQNNTIGVDVDSEYKLWTLDNTGNIHQLNKHYDLMIIDFERKVTYFREAYDQVRIS